MQVISIVNLQGGVGKTTTAVNMAYELAVHHNRRVLLIDADHQGNASKFYGARASVGSLSDLRDAIMEDGSYDCMVIDCPPAFTAASVSAIAAATDIIIPIKLDYYAIDGMRELVSQLRQIQTITEVHIAGALITQWRNTDVIQQGETWLRMHEPCPVFDTHIRRTDVVDKSTYWRKPLAECPPRSAATADYAAFVREFLGEEAADRGPQI